MNVDVKIWTEGEKKAWQEARMSRLKYIHDSATQSVQGMTREEARIFLLEQSLIQSHHTISFLHSCLTNKDGYRYDYPDQTMDRLKDIKKLVYIPKGCVHSVTNPDCDRCVEHIIIRIKAHKALTFFPNVE